MPSNARDAGLMTPTTSPPLLASFRTFTHVRATAGVQVMLSEELAADMRLLDGSLAARTAVAAGGVIFDGAAIAPSMLAT